MVYSDKAKETDFKLTDTRYALSAKDSTSQNHGGGTQILFQAATSNQDNQDHPQMATQIG